jgi:hypothetical protein
MPDTPILQPFEWPANWATVVVPPGVTSIRAAKGLPARPTRQPLPDPARKRVRCEVIHCWSEAHAERDMDDGETAHLCERHAVMWDREARRSQDAPGPATEPKVARTAFRAANGLSGYPDRSRMHGSARSQMPSRSTYARKMEARRRRARLKVARLAAAKIDNGPGSG